METKGDVSKVETRKDTKGRRQVARKPRPSNRLTKKGRNAASAAPATTSAAPATTSATPVAATATPITSTAAATATPITPTPAAAPVNTDKPSYRELEILIEGFKSEIEELKAVRTLPALIEMLAEQLRYMPMGERVHAMRSLVEKADITQTDVLEQAVKTSEPDNAPAPSDPTDQWKIAVKKYQAGWFWTATDDENEKQGGPVKTKEEAEADARAAIARKDKSTESATRAAA